MKIRIKTPDRTLTATLASNQTARDFASLLPLTLELNDYAKAERISDLPRKLATADAPPGAKPNSGDIAYYSPWGNLAIFYRDQPHATGLIILGTIDAGDAGHDISALTTVTIERDVNH